ncbi:amidase [Actinoplanes sp. NPDC051861]|uniref:amidase n=1 Tax=Actinoplanes sp. NPDC051861 TaxID=3155170 RepID=UPI00342C88A6
MRLVDLSAAALSEAVRTREVSCVEVMTAYLDHIDELNPRLNAIVSLRPRADLLAEAAEKDRQPHRGWMHGFPHAVKDLADARGLPTSFGLSLFPPARTDSVFVERIRAAGAIVIGKTNVPQLGLGSHTYNDVFGTTMNAFDHTRSAGGSSGGAAVAVATGMVPVADGSDFMGSLRNPPGWNNVYGLRPSVGRVPSAGGDLFADQGGVAGPIARTAGDLALLLDTMAGYDDRAPLSLDGYRPRPETGRLAWLGDLGGYLPMDPEVLTVTTAALSAFGMPFDTIDELPGLGNDALWPLWLTYRHWLAGMAVKQFHDEPDLRPLLKPEAVFEYEGLTRLSAIDVGEASLRRSELYEAFRKIFQTYEYAILPTAQIFPFDAALPWPAEINGTAMSSYHRWMEVTAIATLINAPVLAVPAGFSSTGLPIGLQIIGRNHDDRGLLDFANSWEKVLRR